ncbi:hypothetical protein [Lachnobacterium bovis]|uniref:Lipoprotein n=1 Tax=Lachnobacterium bovis TaxID=140626 RepID=A0A1H9TF49_9FIRM|nr:hypothetical protein [Lachnobacterium bovis]SER95822.1 hypothetical protein SAMN02910429_01616 [Lachnobacterium bovis]
MKKVTLFTKIFLIATITCAFFTGCETSKKAEPSNTENKQTSQKNSNKGSSTTNSKTKKSDKALAEYKIILTNLHNEHKLRDKEVKLAQASDIENNQYAIYDVDKDGQDELIILFTTADNDFVQGKIYGYDSKKSEIVEKLDCYPSVHVYDNGIVIDDVTVALNRSADRLWPYGIWKYDASQNKYVNHGYLSQIFADDSETESEELDPFPTDKDKDKDDTLYVLKKQNEETKFMDKADYEEFRDGFLKNAKEVKIDYKNLTLKNINNSCKEQ